MSPKISIIVPVYKVVQFLPKCIESILAQTFADFELLLIDDGSPDASGEICEVYARKDSRIRVFHKANGGVSSARNRGLAEARGAWVAFVDADDWLTPEYLTVFMRSSDLREDTLLFQGYKKVFQHGEVEFRLQEHRDGEENIVKNNLFFYWGVWGKLFNLQIIRLLGLQFDETLSLGEDTVFFFQYLSRVSRLCVVMASGYNYRNTAVSLSKKPLPWEAHFAGSQAITAVAFPQVKRLLKGNFFYRKRFLNLLIYEQHALRLGVLYDEGYDRKARIQLLDAAFGDRWRLLCSAYPLFSLKVKYSILWFFFLTLPLCVVDGILKRLLKTE